MDFVFFKKSEIAGKIIFGFKLAGNTFAGYFFEIAALTSADPSSYDVPQTEFASDAGLIKNVDIKNDIVTVTVDGSAVKLPVSIESAR